MTASASSATLPAMRVQFGLGAVLHHSARPDSRTRTTTRTKRLVRTGVKVVWIRITRSQ